MSPTSKWFPPTLEQVNAAAWVRKYGQGPAPTPVRLLVEKSPDPAEDPCILDDTEPTFVSLRELLETPSHLSPPTEVAHRLAYEGRAIVVASKDKLGKSTAAATAAADVTRGRVFLGKPTFKGRVRWAGLEEHRDDAIQRFVELDADPSQIEIAVAKPATVLNDIRDRLRQQTFVWCVVDSIMEYARVVTNGNPPSEGDSSGWSSLIRPLTSVAHDTGVAVTLLHHVRKDGEERGSTEVFAAIDGLWVMGGPKSGEDPRTRHFKGRGRRGLDFSEFSIRWDGSDHEMVGGAELSLDARVLLHVERTPGLSSNKLRQAVGGRGSDVDASVRELDRRHAIRNAGTPEASKWVPFAWTGNLP